MKRSGDKPSLVSLTLVMAALALTPLAGTAFAQPSASTAEASANEKAIRAATTLFYEALNTAIQGNFDPLSAIWSHRPDISDFSADGSEEFGWNAVHEHIRNTVRLYPSGRIGAQDVRVIADGDADGDIGYSVVIETGQMRSPDGPMVKFSQRATNIFRREQGQWKLIHHHADGSLNDGAQVPTR